MVTFKSHCNDIVTTLVDQWSIQKKLGHF